MLGADIDGGLEAHRRRDLAAREQALQKALDLSYAFINRRERTVAEVRSQLERKGVSETDADAAVQTLIEQHLLDDERFAQLFVSDKRELERWGAERIRRGLSARGIDRALAEQTLAATPDAVDVGPTTMAEAASWRGRSSCCAAGSPTPRRSGVTVTVRSGCCCARAMSRSWRSTRSTPTRAGTRSPPHPPARTPPPRRPRQPRVGGP